MLDDTCEILHHLSPLFSSFLFGNSRGENQLGGLAEEAFVFPGNPKQLTDNRHWRLNCIVFEEVGWWSLLLDGIDQFICYFDNTWTQCISTLYCKCLCDQT